jgi:hypothetical protein
MLPLNGCRSVTSHSRDRKQKSFEVIGSHSRQKTPSSVRLHASDPGSHEQLFERAALSLVFLDCKIPIAVIFRIGLCVALFWPAKLSRRVTWKRLQTKPGHWGIGQADEDASVSPVSLPACCSEWFGSTPTCQGAGEHDGSKRNDFLGGPGCR